MLVEFLLFNSSPTPLPSDNTLSFCLFRTNRFLKDNHKIIRYNQTNTIEKDKIHAQKEIDTGRGQLIHTLGNSKNH